MLRVLVLSRNYPNNITNLLGLWAERLVLQSKKFCEPTVVSPVPYCPGVPGLPRTLSRFRSVTRYRVSEGIPVYHPRFLTGPGNSTYSLEARLYFAGVRNLVGELWKRQRFDLIHAHFTYPDGVVATKLGQRYGVPVVITEHIPWEVWANHHWVLRQAIGAVKQSQIHISVSRSTLNSVERYIRRDHLTIIPNGVNGAIFKPLDDATRRNPSQILFVGAVRPVKGLEVLLRAMRVLGDRGREANLVVIGDPFYAPYQREEIRLRKLVRDLALQGNVQFVGRQSPSEVAVFMARSSVTVLPSYLESFGSVLIESLACGTPVVATRCGGPEDIVNSEVGVLNAVGDPDELANGIEYVLDHQSSYDPVKLRAYALEKFGLESVGRRLQRVYEQALEEYRDGMALQRRSA